MKIWIISLYIVKNFRIKIENTKNEFKKYEQCIDEFDSSDENNIEENERELLSIWRYRKQVLEEITNKIKN